tara:strand:+ start:7336 stop:7794 length:459 start_codon:yes stop_codon:yes gene_type:complete
MSITRIPPVALLLGLAGLIPFVWGALLVLGIWAPGSFEVPKVLSGDGRLVMIRYGGIILPFMSGVLWGFATRAEGAQAAMGYGFSVVPALWWFFMPGAGVISALINLATGFAGLLLLDYMFQRWHLAPAWWLTLRLQLTIVVLLCLGIGIWA